MFSLNSVLIAVRLGCDYAYDQLVDLPENHRNLRAIIGLGDCDETSFHHKRIRNNFCLIRPATIEQMSRAIVGEGHNLKPDAVQKVHADSFVMETNIHYPPAPHRKSRNQHTFGTRTC